MANKNTADIGFEKQIWDAAWVVRILVEVLKPFKGRVYDEAVA